MEPRTDGTGADLLDCYDIQDQSFEPIVTLRFKDF